MLINVRACLTDPINHSHSDKLEVTQQIYYFVHTKPTPSSILFHINPCFHNEVKLSLFVMNACSGSRSTAPLILNIDAVSLIPVSYEPITIQLCDSSGARGGAVGSGTELQAGRSCVRFPMVSQSFQPHYCLGVE
jgi:hypothetical protein